MSGSWKAKKIRKRRLTGIADGKVPEPVAGDGEGHGLRADLKREDFASDDPSDRTPGGSEERLLGME